MCCVSFVINLWAETSSTSRKTLKVQVMLLSCLKRRDMGVSRETCATFCFSAAQSVGHGYMHQWNRWCRLVMERCKHGDCVRKKTSVLQTSLYLLEIGAIKMNTTVPGRVHFISYIQYLNHPFCVIRQCVHWNTLYLLQVPCHWTPSWEHIFDFLA